MNTTFLLFFDWTEGLDTPVMVGKDTVITVDAAEAGTGKVTCRIRSPSGSDIDIDIVENVDGTFSIHFTPQFPGTYTISIKFGGQPVPQGDYMIEVRDSVCCMLYQHPLELRITTAKKNFKKKKIVLVERLFPEFILKG